MSRPNHTTISATNALPKVVRGRGSYLWDATGKQYIDGSGGPAVYCLGHAHPEVNRAICDQLEGWPSPRPPLAFLTILLQSRPVGRIGSAPMDLTSLSRAPKARRQLHTTETLVFWRHRAGLRPLTLT